MSAPQPGPREIVSGLADALLPALPAEATPQARTAAREVAQVLGLDGLSAALAQLERLAGAPRAVEADHLAARVERLSAAAVREGDLSVFQAADRELAGLAAQLDDVEWSGSTPPLAPPVATWELGETFADARLEAAPEVARLKLTMSVASALRAAADWLGADENTRVTASVHDSAVALTMPVRDADGIGPAGAVLATVEGSMGAEADGRWTLRVPRVTERPSFLLVRQGRFGFALPWHAVARLRMFAPHELDRLVEPRLDPLAALAPGTSERPAAMMALGLSRAWFIADRIVWRIAAHAEESDVAGPFAGATRVVQVESGERYWVLEPAWLLRGVVPAPPPARPGAGAPKEPPPAAPAEAQAAPPAPGPAPAVAIAETSAESLAAAAERALALLRGEREAALRAEAARAATHGPPAPPPPHVEDAAALVDAAFSFEVPAPAVPAPGPAPAPPAPLTGADAVLFSGGTVPGPPAELKGADAVLFSHGPAFEPARLESPSGPVQRSPERRALVADDSFVARIFLGRLLEQRGWIVESVADSASLWRELGHGPWALVCADFALPDATGHAHVQRLVEHLRRAAGPATFVVLTRDEEEERIAREAGAALSLRKPFDAVHLDTLLAR